MLEKIESDPDFTITVKRGAWCDANGNESPSGKRNKAHQNYKTLTETYKKGDGVLTEALEAIRKSLTKPAESYAEYTKIGNGVYVDDKGAIHIRDLRKVSKKVIVKGDYPQKATSARVAIQDAIKKDMPIGNYRQFRLDCDYDTIKVGGVELTHEVEGEYEAS
jgi:hypothetical protein